MEIPAETGEEIARYTRYVTEMLAQHAQAAPLPQRTPGRKKDEQSGRNHNKTGRRIRSFPLKNHRIA
jgi:hypothetical protein